MRSIRASVGVGCLVIIALIVLGIVGFFWQRGFMPHIGVGEMAWWQGLIQGFYALPNFIVNFFVADKTLDIYQSGAGGWYQLFYLIGIGSFFGSASSMKS